MKFVLLSGSFRKESKTLALLRAVQELFPEHSYELAQLDQIRFYNADLEPNKPVEVVSLIESVGQCDGVIVCSPEYNHSVPAVLKNAIDWASRPAFNSVLKDKPVTIITQANSPVGGARVHEHLKLIFSSTLSNIHPSLDMMIPAVGEAFNDKGKLVNPQVEERLKRHLSGFFDYASR